MSSEEMLFKEKVYGRRTKTDLNSSTWAFGSGEIKITKSLKFCKLTISLLVNSFQM